MENSTLDTKPVGSAPKKKTGPIVITSLILIVLVVFSLGLMSSNKEISLTGSAVQSTMTGDGYELTKTLNFDELSNIQQAKWGGADVIKSGTRWTYQKGNETIIIRQREFYSSFRAVQGYMGARKSDDPHKIADHKLAQGTFTAVYFPRPGISALTAIVWSGDKLIEVSYSNNGSEYEFPTTGELESDRANLIKLTKGLLGIGLF